MVEDNFPRFCHYIPDVSTSYGFVEKADAECSNFRKRERKRSATTSCILVRVHIRTALYLLESYVMLFTSEAKYQWNSPGHPIVPSPCPLFLKFFFHLRSVPGMPISAFFPKETCTGGNRMFALS